MFKKIKYLIVFATLALGSIQGYSQFTMPAKNFELDKPLPSIGNVGYMARDYIKLKPGFSFKPESSNAGIKCFIDEFMTFGADYLSGTNPVPTVPFSTSNSIGTIPGSAGVSPRGAATYTIPINLPPGTAGVMPNLSIVYNSQSGSGMLGHGWTIGGFSAITRMGTNLHDDGYIDGVDFDDNDQFALDGNRLIPISSGEYRTQAETHSKITSSGSINGAPESFTVETKDGRTLEYSYAEYSNDGGAGKEVVYWLLKKVSDISRNYYTITYTKINNEYFPKEIKYTGNDAAGLSPYNTIKFHFDKKIDSDVAFIGSVQINSTVILREIVVDCEGSLAYKYQFNYKNVETKSKLTEIIYYAGSSMLNSTKIKWFERISTNRDDYPVDFSADGAQSRFIPADFNGDGYTDMVQVVYDGSNVSKIKLLKNNTTNNIVSGDFSSIYSKDINSKAEFQPGDFNGDGKTDLLIVRENKVSLFVTQYNIDILLSSGTGFIEIELGKEYISSTLHQNKFTVGDFNADGKTDWVIMNPAITNTIEVYTLTSGTTAPTSSLLCTSDKFNLETDNYRVADFNGNGKTDLMLIDDYGDYACQILEYDGSSTLNLINHGSYPTKNHRIFLGDFNGDRKKDILTWHPSKGWEAFYFGKDGFISSIQPSLSQNNPAHPNWIILTHDDPYASPDFSVFISDINGDGKDDIFQISEEQGAIKHTVFHSKGLGFNKDIWYYWSKQNPDVPHVEIYDHQGFIDFNADGKEDILLADYNDPSKRYIAYIRPSENPTFVESITNGFDKVTTFEYLPYTNNKVWLPGSGNDPVNDLLEIRPPIMVTYKIHTPDGEGGDGEISTRYWYQGLKLHKKGKGLLGFEACYSAGIGRSISYYGYEPVFFSSFLRKTKNYDGVYETEINYTNKVKSLSTSLGEKRYFPYVDIIEEKDLETGITITTDNTYGDDYGNLTLQTITHGSDGTTEIKNEDYVTAGRWCLSMPGKTTVIKSRPDEPSITNIAKFTYTNGVLSKTISEPESPKELTKEIASNSLGLPEIITISAPEEEDRNTTLKYDNKYRFVEEKTNPLDFIIRQTFDAKTGNVLTETDILGNMTRHTYDAFGNLLTSSFPNNTSLSIERKWDRNTNLKTAYYIKETATESNPVITHYNHLGKEVQTEAKNFNDVSVFTNTEYNKWGQIAKKYGPGTSSKSGEETIFEYHPNNKRLQVITSPIGETSYIYQERKTTIIPPSGQETSTTINAYGEVALAEDNGGKINYYYNSAGQPNSIVAPGGATVTIKYDRYGNKKSITDPDAGKITYDYDAFGNLTSQTDAKNNNFAMTYDKLNRLLTKTGPEGLTRYTYDNAINGKGQIESVIGPSPNNIRQSYEYDGLGNLVKLTEEIDGRPFVYSYTYDNYGRQSKTTYPSGFATENEYNKNYLKAVKSSDGPVRYWEGLEYNEFGQLLQARYGNTQTVTKGYDTDHRLNSIDYCNYATFGYTYYKETGNLERRGPTHNMLRL
jgi:YD repeat-containing protein